jgi:hypothetical protein
LSNPGQPGPFPSGLFTPPYFTLALFTTQRLGAATGVSGSASTMIL